MCKHDIATTLMMKTKRESSFRRRWKSERSTWFDNTCLQSHPTPVTGETAGLEVSQRECAAFLFILRELVNLPFFCAERQFPEYVLEVNTFCRVTFWIFLLQLVSWCFAFPLRYHTVVSFTGKETWSLQVKCGCESGCAKNLVIQYKYKYSNHGTMHYHISWYC